MAFVSFQQKWDHYPNPIPPWINQPPWKTSIAILIFISWNPAALQLPEQMVCFLGPWKVSRKLSFLWVTGFSWWLFGWCWNHGWKGLYLEISIPGIDFTTNLTTNYTTTIFIHWLIPKWPNKNQFDRWRTSQITNHNQRWGETWPETEDHGGTMDAWRQVGVDEWILQPDPPVAGCLIWKNFHSSKKEWHKWDFGAPKQYRLGNFLDNLEGLCRLVKYPKTSSDWCPLIRLISLEVEGFRKRFTSNPQVQPNIKNKNNTATAAYQK